MVTTRRRRHRAGVIDRTGVIDRLSHHGRHRLSYHRGRLDNSRRLSYHRGRLGNSRRLDNGCSYQQAGEATGASSATIGRVKKCLDYGAGGYRIILNRMSEGEKSGE